MGGEGDGDGGSGTSDADRVAAVLSDQILGGRRQPGARLPTQAELAAEFGVQRGVIRSALEKLRAEGLIKVGRGAPATVLGVPRRQSGAEKLHEHLVSAFRQPEVTIDTYSYTTETLNKAFESLELAEDTAPPRSVRVRALLPSADRRLGVPFLVEDRDDELPSQRMHAYAEDYVEHLRRTLENLTVRGKVDGPATVEVRRVPVTPEFKFYLLNGTEALEGKYPLKERDVRYRRRTRGAGREVDVWLRTLDVAGVDAPLFHYLAADPHGAQKCDELSTFFEDRWNLVAVAQDDAG